MPILERMKLFEMPLPGYLGFPAFAFECFTMYLCLRLIARRVRAMFHGPGRGDSAPSGLVGPARTIAL